MLARARLVLEELLCFILLQLLDVVEVLQAIEQEGLFLVRHVGRHSAFAKPAYVVIAAEYLIVFTLDEDYGVLVVAFTVELSKVVLI